VSEKIFWWFAAGAFVCAAFGGCRTLPRAGECPESKGMRCLIEKECEEDRVRRCLVCRCEAPFFMSTPPEQSPDSNRPVPSQPR